MPAKQAKRQKKLRKRRKTSSVIGPSLSRHYDGPGRSQVDLEQHLLSRPFVSRPLPDLPWSIEQITVEMKRIMPKDLKGTIHSDGRITIPLDAKHRATNWREILEHLERLGASKEEIARLSEATEHRIIERLKQKGRIVEAFMRDKIPAPDRTGPASGSDPQELPAVKEREKAELTPANIPQNTLPVEMQGEISHSEEEAPLGSLSIKELFDLARGIRGQPHKKSDAEVQQSRSKVVKAFARACANGICQFCGNPAQYNDLDGTPRLHVHHICYLGEDGEDSIENVVAICPNCHDIIHVRQDEKDAALLRARVHEHLSCFTKHRYEPICVLALHSANYNSV
ncbi:MAG: HNH endonuclease [Desulfomonilaceae bacterium]